MSSVEGFFHLFYNSISNNLAFEKLFRKYKIQHLKLNLHERSVYI